MNKNYLKYRKNYNSQSGEDGVIEQLVEELEIKSGTFVEFGAWNGKYLSNTFALFEKDKEKKLNFVWIEGENSKYDEMMKNYGSSSNLKGICKFVSQDGSHENSLNFLLKDTIVDDFQLLSIDVDGIDFDIWKSLNKKIYKPNIIIIEYSDWLDKDKRLELYQQFRNDGYFLLCVTGNYIFLKQSLCEKIGFEYQDEELLFEKSGHAEIDYRYFKTIDEGKFNCLIHNSTKCWIDKQ